MTNLSKLSKGLELLERARVRKMGYQKWDESAIWFSNYEQEHNIKIIDKAISRLENYCREKCQTILINI